MVRSHRGRSSTEFISIKGECMVRNHRGFIEHIFGGRRGLEATVSSMCRVYFQGVVYRLVLQYRGHRGFAKLKFIRRDVWYETTGVYI